LLFWGQCFNFLLLRSGDRGTSAHRNPRKASQRGDKGGSIALRRSERIARSEKERLVCSDSEATEKTVRSSKISGRFVDSNEKRALHLIEKEKNRRQRGENLNRFKDLNFIEIHFA